MSTEHQQYSIANQSDAIEKYAALRGLTIIRNFVDRGRSGLSLAGRPGLRQLLAEVISGNPEFEHVLVYDVSRWGRFQDTDESAFYEYTCKKANVKIHYCLEQFENDGSAYSTLIKVLKRTMAGEYSRELSNKVFEGQSRLVRMGYWAGSLPGYGLRRLVIDSVGRRKEVLKPGECKAIQSDRVILIPGPKREVDVVRQIFKWYTVGRQSMETIAKLLNERAVAIEPETRWPAPRWTRARVDNILTNPKYLGTNVYNRASQKLRQATVQNPEERWIRVEGAFTPIIAQDLYDKAQKVRESRKRRLTDAEVLDSLRSLLKRKGKLSQDIINDDAETPCAFTVSVRFGSLPEAYQLIGYQAGPSRNVQL
jgi:DNA invertase Pin-like site-specific DNA recombinase